MVLGVHTAATTGAVRLVFGANSAAARAVFVIFGFSATTARAVSAVAGMITVAAGAVPVATTAGAIVTTAGAIPVGGLLFASISGLVLTPIFTAVAVVAQTTLRVFMPW